MKGYLYYTDFLDLSNPDSFKKDVRLNEKFSSEQANVLKAKSKFEQYNVDLVGGDTVSSTGGLLFQ